jgi:hypothetical protein
LASISHQRRCTSLALAENVFIANEKEHGNYRARPRVSNVDRYS